ncbi:TetR/AcrR family transcriptional regulator [Paenibacillus sp. P25]|nr:TetR/AcrR family transcriptional regulator [Paenibacillus sp. P25]
MEVFWEHGFEASSTERLCERTGLGRGSLYNAFGKQACPLREGLEALSGAGHPGTGGNSGTSRTGQRPPARLDGMGDRSGFRRNGAEGLSRRQRSD